MLGRIIKISVSSILQSRPSIIKKIFCLVEQCLFFQFCKKYTVYLSSFLLGRKIKICFLQIYQAVWAIFYSLFCILSKINQGSCLGCLGGDDAPAMCLDSCNQPKISIFMYDKLALALLRIKNLPPSFSIETKLPKVLEIRYDTQSAFMLDQLGKFKKIKDFVDDCYTWLLLP